MQRQLALLGLAKAGRADVILHDFRRRWATMNSVKWNNTIQEAWDAVRQYGRMEPLALSPIYVLFGDIAGIRAAAPGFARVQVRPQLGDLADLELVYRTVRGPIRFKAEAASEGHRVSVSLPKDCEGELLLPKDSKVELDACCRTIRWASCDSG